MQHPFDYLELNTGTLMFTPCPGTKGVSLSDSIGQLKAAGAAAIITLMPTHELEQNDVAQIGVICEELGLEWYQLPIEDDCAPEQAFEAAFTDYKASILALLQAGKKVAIHCKGGSGRTGLMAAILMTQLGYGKTEAQAIVQQLRPKALCHPVHQSYFAKFTG
ncbi:MAG: dual specificity protein phosphatase family protein [Pseudomonadota bacterium]|nr:dual specificity protein phosphatase family protein [Pseudomonadota bacterium]|tara:strand:+ start:848 stop:1336 length:489 start_codon:yes stop_codon:yes gene_type:complete